MKHVPIQRRLWSRILVAPDCSPNGWWGCWLWTGSTDPHGYGHIRGDWGHSLVATHRLAYELTVGPIPEGLQLDHLCRRPACCNPAHLEVVTQRENILRGEGLAAKAAKRTHCPQGHSYSGENLYITTRGTRVCRICSRAHKAAYKRRKRVAA
jgi:hypothetical protein